MKIRTNWKKRTCTIFETITSIKLLRYNDVSISIIISDSEEHAFYERPEVAFRESSRTVITDLDSSQASEFYSYPKKKIDGQYKELETYTEEIKSGETNDLQPQILAVGRTRTKAFELWLKFKGSLNLKMKVCTLLTNICILFKIAS